MKAAADAAEITPDMANEDISGAMSEAMLEIELDGLDVYKRQEYTGDGEYDESGKHVGPKPMTALDYALEKWVGGYDEEGDYTGEGEYDAKWNYVGPAPTQETIDAMGDWTCLLYTSRCV